MRDMVLIKYLNDAYMNSAGSYDKNPEWLLVDKSRIITIRHITDHIGINVITPDSNYKLHDYFEVIMDGRILPYFYTTAEWIKELLDYNFELPQGSPTTMEKETKQ